MLCARVYIPNDILHIAAFWGAVQTLTTWLVWERGGAKAKDAATVWKTAFDLSREAWETCEGECGIVDIRQSETVPCVIKKKIDCETWEEVVDMRLCVPKMRMVNGVLQQDTTGSGGWEDAGDPGDPYDPRTDAPSPAPWPYPPEGETGQCLSAANVAAYVNFAAQDFAAAMVQALTFFETLSAATAILTALMDLIPLTLLTAMITALYTQVIDDWEDVRDFDITSKLVELLLCKYNADGSMTESQWIALITDVNAWRDTLVDNDERAKWWIAIQLMTLWGNVGMTIAGQVWGITTYECDESPCWWSHEWDFTVSGGGWALTGWPDDDCDFFGTYDPGVGWRVTLRTTGVYYCNIGSPLVPSTSIIKKVEIQWLPSQDYNYVQLRNGVYCPTPNPFDLLVDNFNRLAWVLDTETWEGDADCVQLYAVVRNGQSGIPGDQDCWIKKITVWGDGVDPWS
jgi:hypothetical protein